MLVWRDTCEEQLGAGGILAVRTGPMGVPLVAPHRAFQVLRASMWLVENQDMALSRTFVR